MAENTSKTQYEQTTKDENLVEEDISPEILKILGLEDTFDLDYGDYKTLLREKLTELDMKSAQKPGDKKISESQTLLTGEFKRVKRSTGKFKVKSQKVKADKFVNKKAESGNGGPVKPIDSSKLLPPGGVLAKRQPQDEIKPVEKEEKEEEPKEKKEDLSDFFKNLLDSLKGISSIVEDILKILEKQLGLDKKRQESQRRQSELGEAKQEEKNLEKEKKDTGSGLLEKVTKPFTSIFDTIKNFLLNVLIGSVVVWLLKVIKNPMILLKPIQGLVDGIVGFFNSVIKFIDFMVVQPVRNFIDMINSALKGFIDILNSALKMLPGSPQIEAPQAPNIPEAPQIQSPDITGEKKQQQQSSQGPQIRLMTTGGQMTPPKQSGKKQATFDDRVSKEGGTVSSESTSFDVSGLGPDKHLTALSTGEYVLKKGAADYLGGPAYLDPINKMFGGSTERKVASLGDIKIQAANEGGKIGFDPDVYIQGSKQQTLNVGVGKAAKRYAIAYKREGSSGNFTIKQINKVVQGAGLGGLAMLFGATDQLTGVKPSSPEGKFVINSATVRQNLTREAGKIAGPVKIQVDPQADIYWAYKQAYSTTYNKWRNSGANHDVANQYARAAAAEFAVARKGASWKPGSKEGLDAGLKQVEVAGSPSSSAPQSSSDQPSQFAKSFMEVLGDPAKDSPRLKSENASSFLSPQSKANAKEQKPDSKIEGDLAKPVLGKKNDQEKASSGTGNPPGALAPGQRPDKALTSEQFKVATAARAEADKLGLSGLAKDKFVAEKVMSSGGSGLSPATIAPSEKPKQDIPSPPSTKPTITTLPLPSQSQVPTNTGASNQSGNNVPGFSSYRQEEPSLAVVASIYNMWGGL